MTAERKLTDEQIDVIVWGTKPDITADHSDMLQDYWRKIARAIEAAVREQDEALLRQSREALDAANEYMQSNTPCDGWGLRDRAADKERYATLEKSSAAIAALDARLKD